MRSLILSLLAVAMTFVAPSVPAERFMGILPDHRLSDVRALYPNATLRELKPAWLKDHQRLIELSGPGIQGVLAVMLEHEVERLQLFLRQLAIKQANRASLTSDERWALERFPDRIQRLRGDPTADHWEVRDIRWQPESALPLRSLIAKYGNSDSDGLDERFQRIVVWERRGIQAYISDGDGVELLIFTFTIGDIVCAPRWKYGEACDSQNPFMQNDRESVPAGGASSPARNLDPQEE